MQQPATDPSPQEQEEGAEARRQRQIQENQAAIKLLQSWLTGGDPEEQRETWEILRRGLQENTTAFPSAFSESAE